MAVRLAWGVLAERDLGAWFLDTGEPVDPRDHDAPEGAAVALGPKNAAPEQVAAARESLRQLVEDGGLVAAGAGVDLGAGFVSARLAGAGGDRRDAVLAALRALGTTGASRLGERTATLVALFGVTATKPVGAAAERAIAEERWPAVTLASAAADILGPEQLEHILASPAPDGVDPIPSGAPSALATNLRRVLEPQTDRVPVEADHCVPRLDSIPLAVAGTAQLMALGATPPVRCRDWGRLCAGLLSSGSVMRALVEEFEVPEVVLAHEGEVLPEIGLRVEVARNAGRLAEWSAYMGNCIAGPWYQEEAVRGRSVLLALRDERDTILVNVELRAAGRGWFVNEIGGRFNGELDPALRKSVLRWVSTVRALDEDDAEVPDIDVPVRVRRSALDPVREIRPALCASVRGTLKVAAPARRTVAIVGVDADGDPKTLTALRRSSSDRLARLCVEALESGRVTLAELWSATGARPLAAAVAAQPERTLTRYPRLHTLAADAPIPSKRLRDLVKEPDLATARSMDVVATRMRAVLGGLALTGDPAFTRAVIREPSIEMLCALVPVVTCRPDNPFPTLAIAEPRAVIMPGFPASDLSDPDGPWQRAWPVAAEFGAETERFWDQVAETGVLVPATWLAAGGWQGLWSKAAAHAKQS
ncbi:hypothetical protein [Nocardia sp. NPDC020380]|uniref:hypothetical protein n=1 Tax=Nocardia sp. NPDC020380 TaxID=3364309 RepID=UPI0037AE909C